jgi:hypothetical protein
MKGLVLLVAVLCAGCIDERDTIGAYHKAITGICGDALKDPGYTRWMDSCLRHEQELSDTLHSIYSLPPAVRPAGNTI